MKVKYLIFAIAFALLNVGCSEKKEPPNDLNKQSEETETVLEDSSNVVEPMPREPKYQTKGCLQGCRGLPCDETARCVQRNCPNVKVTCDDDEHGVFIGDESLKRVEKQQHDKIQAKFNTHAECVKSQNVDILKDSVRFKAVFDSCWRERMTGL